MKKIRIKKPVWRVGIVLAFCLFVLLFAKDASAPSENQTNQASQNQTSTPSFNKQAHSLDEPGSMWWVVNKTRPLSPAQYAPSDLVVPNVARQSASNEARLSKDTAAALGEMFSAAQKARLNLRLTSGYRSYQYQVSVYNGYVEQYGQAGADKVSARPGTSEHQTGMAADLEPSSGRCRLDVCFADLAEGKWLAANAYAYGFILRYPEGKEKITGYMYEPWHFRYVGKELSQEMHNQGVQTMEEFFDIVPDKQPY